MESEVQHDDLLAEMFMQPSEEVKTERFSSTQEENPAPCNGSCMSGSCR